MAVAPFELQRITADWFDILQHDQHRHIIRFESQFARPFIRTSGTRAMLAQKPNGIDALVAVIPGHPKDPLRDPLHIGRLKSCAVSHQYALLIKTFCVTT
jgi:hypothetical protein